MLLLPEDMRSYLPHVPDMQSYLCQGDTRHVCTYSTPPRMPIPTLFVQVRMVYDHNVRGTRATLPGDADLLKEKHA
jgi:hypothetical protein